MLAVGYKIGFRGGLLGPFSALIAWGSMISFSGSLRALARTRSAWVSGLGAGLVASLGWLGFVWWSGMEVALFAAVLGRALVCVMHASESTLRHGARRPGAALRAGLWCALLVWLRPEAVVVVACAATMAGRAAKDRSALALMARVAVPPAAAIGVVLVANRIFTGTFASAGAELKLLSANPYLSDVDRAREFLMNLAYLEWKVVDVTLSPMRGGALLLFALAGVSLLSSRTRAMGATCLGSAALFTLLVSWNGAARYQNFRYYAPPALLVLVAVALGASVLARHRSAVVSLAGVGWLAIVTGAALAASQPQVDLFRDASRNIAEQQVEVGRRLARSVPVDGVVMIGDAGAIPYLSRRGALDAMGLGGYHGFPFATAAPHGEAAILELLERVPVARRPTHLALYLNWFPETTSRFGVELDRVAIEGNVICGGPVKGIYHADFTALRAPEAVPPRFERLVAHGDWLDEVDVADVIDERAHGYVHPAPNGGWTTLDVKVGPEGRVFDGGRILPAGTSESFSTSAKGEVVIVSRVGDEVTAVDVNGVSLVLATSAAGAWRLAHGRLSLGEGERITVRGTGELRSFHHWIFAAR